MRAFPSAATSEVPGVIQVVEAGGQYQVCIGTSVEKMYDEVVALTAGLGVEMTQRLRSSTSIV